MPRFYIKFWIALLLFIVLVSLVASFFGVGRPINEGMVDLAELAKQATATGEKKPVAGQVSPSATP